MRISQVLRNNLLKLDWPKSQFPTPYEIIRVPPSASQAEIKKAYYELVKVYHPDKLPRDVKPTHEHRERFHKIVAANDLLCDKARRSAFDQFGAGWQWGGSSGGHSKVYAGQMSGSRFDRYNRSRRANHAETDAWDAFYTGNKTSGEKPRYTSNSHFIVFVVIFSAIGTLIQAVRLGKASAEINERADKNHFNTARDLAESRRLAKNLNKEERRKLFLAHRNGDLDGYGHDPT